MVIHANYALGQPENLVSNRFLMPTDREDFNERRLFKKQQVKNKYIFLIISRFY